MCGQIHTFLCAVEARLPPVAQVVRGDASLDACEACLLWQAPIDADKYVSIIMVPELGTHFDRNLSFLFNLCSVSCKSFFLLAHLEDGMLWRTATGWFCHHTNSTNARPGDVPGLYRVRVSHRHLQSASGKARIQER